MRHDDTIHKSDMPWRGSNTHYELALKLGYGNPDAGERAVYHDAYKKGAIRFHGTPSAGTSSELGLQFDETNPDTVARARSLIRTLGKGRETIYVDGIHLKTGGPRSSTFRLSGSPAEVHAALTRHSERLASSEYTQKRCESVEDLILAVLQNVPVSSLLEELGGVCLEAVEGIYLGKHVDDPYNKGGHRIPIMHPDHGEIGYLYGHIENVDANGNLSKTGKPSYNVNDVTIYPGSSYNLHGSVRPQHLVGASGIKAMAKELKRRFGVSSVHSNTRVTGMRGQADALPATRPVSIRGESVAESLVGAYLSDPVRLVDTPRDRKDRMVRFNIEHPEHGTIGHLYGVTQIVGAKQQYDPDGGWKVGRPKGGKKSFNITNVGFNYGALKKLGVDKAQMALGVSTVRQLAKELKRKTGVGRVHSHTRMSGVRSNRPYSPLNPVVIRGESVADQLISNALDESPEEYTGLTVGAGWIDPKNKYHKVGHDQTHAAWALRNHELVNSFGPVHVDPEQAEQAYDRQSYEDDAQTSMIKHGWIRKSGPDSYETKRSRLPVAFKHMAQYHPHRSLVYLDLHHEHGGFDKSETMTLYGVPHLEDYQRESNSSTDEGFSDYQVYKSHKNIKTNRAYNQGGYDRLMHSRKLKFTDFSSHDYYAGRGMGYGEDPAVKSVTDRHRTKTFNPHDTNIPIEVHNVNVFKGDKHVAQAEYHVLPIGRYKRHAHIAWAEAMDTKESHPGAFKAVLHHIAMEHPKVNTVSARRMTGVHQGPITYKIPSNVRNTQRELFK